MAARRKSPPPSQQTLFAAPRWLETELRTQGHHAIVGIDEAGRGPLAGPVVAAAVLLPPEVDIPVLNDSKKLTEKQREALFPQIHDIALAVGVGIVDASGIDELNILQATKKGMRLAVDAVLRQCAQEPDLLLVDGNHSCDHRLHTMPVVKGDQRCQTVAAASVVAKVTRDKLMDAYDLIYPQYQFKAHKGYPTPLHKELLVTYGPSPVHRLTFKGVLPTPLPDETGASLAREDTPEESDANES